MNDERPDPDQLLDRVKAEEAKAKRGKLKIFFGASAGVGKTYAMLGEARQQLLQKVDVIIGIVETHGRMETEVMADGLERLPLCEIPYRNRLLKEFDLDAALARHPAIILMDELAHSNVAGSRHPKRWQDVEEFAGGGDRRTRRSTFSTWKRSTTSSAALPAFGSGRRCRIAFSMRPTKSSSLTFRQMNCLSA